MRRNFSLDTARGDGNSLVLGQFLPVEHCLQCCACTKLILNMSLCITIVLSCWPGQRPINKAYICFCLVIANGKELMYTQ